jgi:hypothetical protein
MIAMKKSQKDGPTIPPLRGERAGVRASYSLPTLSALTKSPVRATDSSPGSASLRAQPWVKSYIIPAADCEAARSAKLICGSPIRPIGPIRPIPPHPKSIPLIQVDTNLSPTLYKPKIRPENKGIKPKSNRHRPKNSIIGRHAWWPSARTSVAKQNLQFLFCSFPWSIPSRPVQPTAVQL